MDFAEYCYLVLIITTTYKCASALIKWPDEIRGREFTLRRQYLRRKAKRCRLEGETLYIKAPAADIRAVQGPNGK